MLPGLAAGLAAAVLFGVAAVVQAHAVRRRASPAHLGRFVVAGVRDPVLVAVVLAYLVGFVLHAVAIWLLPLYLAQAAVALSLPVTALASRRLAEGLGPREWLGVGGVTCGLVLLAFGAGEPGDVVTTWTLPAALAATALLLLASGLFLGRLGGVALGWLAGLGYAGSAIAVRGVTWPVGPPVLAAAVLVPALGLVAFWLYSVGLQRRFVAASTAPLITAQTFVPALVGLAWLGDGVRAGWGLAVAAGLVLAVAGSGVVVQDDARAGGV